MDSRTLKALEYPKVLEHLSGFCLSLAGKRSALELLPNFHLDTVLHWQLVYDEVKTWLASTHFKLNNFPDLAEVIPALDKTHLLDLDALVALREIISLASQARQSMETCENLPNLTAMLDNAPLPELSLMALNRCLTPDGIIRDESSPELLLVRTELRRLHQGCLRKVKDFANQYNIAHYLQDEYMTLASDRYVLPLKSNFKGRVQGIIHDYSNTGETCYFEPMFLVEQNNKLQELKREERVEEQKIIQHLASLLLQEQPQVLSTWNLLVRLDLEIAKTVLGTALQGNCVHLSSDILSLLQARHPLLALDPSLEHQGGPQPVDLILRQDERILVISGGNAGGKTVCLKTLGLIAAMSLAGLPVPVAKGSALPFWSNIHAFIGDEQSLDDHLSTFTAQINYLAKAWPQTNAHTLVLLDEFGAGTDPAQGAALAQAVLDGLMDLKAHVLAATHFPALKTYALTRPGVRAASVLFNPNTKKPLFKLAYDQVGASQALDVAKEHGLPESVLSKAEQYLLLDGQDMTGLLGRLNNLAAQREHELEVLTAEQNRIRDKRKALQARFDQEKAALITQVQNTTAQILKDWQQDKLHKKSLKELSNLKKTLTQDPTPQKAQFTLADLKPGDQVLHRPWNKKAVIREVDSKGQKVKLDMNGVTMWAEAGILDLPSGKPMPAPVAKTSYNLSPSSQISYLSLDLRGKRADLAISELSSYLDRALLNGRDGVEIIHGRGTGALRKEVHSFLKTYPHLASYALAPEDQGGDGVTLVIFK